MLYGGGKFASYSIFSAAIYLLSVSESSMKFGKFENGKPLKPVGTLGAGIAVLFITCNELRLIGEGPTLMLWPDPIL